MSRSAVLAVLTVAVMVLASCEIPEPSQDAVLREGYLAYPGATKVKEEFTRGSTGGMNVDGGEVKSNSVLELVYKLEQPTRLQDIWDWYEKAFEDKGWSSYQDEYELRFRKRHEGRYHRIAVDDLDELYLDSGAIARGVRVYHIPRAVS